MIASALSMAGSNRHTRSEARPKRGLAGLVLLVLGLVAAPAPAAPQGGAASGAVPSLSPQDYIDIQQLVARYAFAIDNCTNNGHDYADLYTPDGWFAPSQGGRLLTKYEGRDRLAEAALGGAKDCAGVPWKGITHMLVNHVIQPSREGAIGKVYLVAIGLDGEPGKVEAQGHYEDVYVKTSKGWLFKSRVHVLSPKQDVISRGSKPPQPGASK
jgi:hypothetical protein